MKANPFPRPARAAAALLAAGAFLGLGDSERLRADTFAGERWTPVGPQRVLAETYRDIEFLDSKTALVRDGSYDKPLIRSYVDLATATPLAAEYNQPFAPQLLELASDRSFAIQRTLDGLLQRAALDGDAPPFALPSDLLVERGYLADGDALFVGTGARDGKVAFAIDVATGAIAWERSFDFPTYLRLAPDAHRVIALQQIQPDPIGHYDRLLVIDGSTGKLVAQRSIRLSVSSAFHPFVVYSGRRYFEALDTATALDTRSGELVALDAASPRFGFTRFLAHSKIALIDSSDGSIATFHRTSDGAQVAARADFATPGDPDPSQGRVAVSPDARAAYVATGRSLRAWDLDTGALQATLDQSEAEIFVLAISDDGRYLAAALLSGHIQFWDTAGGNSLGKAAFGLTIAGLSSFEFAPDSSRVVLGLYDGAVAADAAQPNAEAVPLFRARPVLAGYDAQRDQFVAFYRDGEIARYDPRTHEQVEEFRHEPSLQALAVSTEAGTYLAHGGYSLQLRDLDTGATLWSAPEEDRLDGWGMSRDGRRFFAQRVSGEQIRVYDIESADPILELQGDYFDDVSSLPAVLSLDGRYLVEPVREEPSALPHHLLLRDLDADPRASIQLGPFEDLVARAVSRDSTKLYAFFNYETDGWRLDNYQLATGELSASVSGSEYLGYPTLIEFGEPSRLLLYSDDGILRQLDLETGRILAQARLHRPDLGSGGLPMNEAQLALSADRRSLLLLRRDQRLLGFRARSQRAISLVLVGHPTSDLGVRFPTRLGHEYLLETSSDLEIWSERSGSLFPGAPSVTLGLPSPTAGFPIFARVWEFEE